MKKHIQSLIIISLLLFVGNYLIANEQIRKPQDKYFLMQLDNVSKTYNTQYGKTSNKLQNAPQFFVLDSLANAYSYYTTEQNPFMYHSETNTLVTIKRGYTESDAGTTQNPYNTKNNLFVIASKNLGYDWSQPELVYNKNSLDYGDARYPSVYPFMYSGVLSYGYMAPVSTGTGWHGFIQGFYTDGDWFADKIYEFEDDRNDSYVFEGTSNSLIAYEKDDSFFMFGISSVAPPEGTSDLTDQSGFGYIKSQDLGDWLINVPEKWNSEIFEPVKYQNADSYKSRYSSTVGLEKRDGDKWYMAACGIFKAGEVQGRSEPGVSTSEDDGITWSEFNLFPYSLIKQYATSIGCDPDSSVLYYYDWAFNTYKKDSYSFMGFLLGNDIEKKPLKYQIVELNYENNTWSVRKIADHAGYNYILYTAPEAGTQPTNQMSWEFQLSKTVDNSTIIAKWAQFYDTMDEEADTVIKAGAHDVFVSTRIIGEDTWSKPYNVTQTPEYDRITWIPNLVPNDLKDIPLLKLWTNCDPTKLTASEYYSKQKDLEVPQYILMTHFNADPISKVESEINYGLEFNGIYPNPANDKIEITISINKYDFYTIDIYDVLGNKMNNVFTGYQSAGLKAIVYNTEKLNSGTYFCVITSSNGNLTKSFNVVK